MGYKFKKDFTTTHSSHESEYRRVGGLVVKSIGMFHQSNASMHAKVTDI